MRSLKVLVACEESQAVTKAFRKLGHRAYSCDLLPCSGGHPEWHLQGDAIELANSADWDLMIAHPPCTYLAVSGARWLYNKDGTRNEERFVNQAKGLAFVRQLMDAPIDYIVIENPVSVISSQIRKPNQIVQPYHFGDEASKKTCLWTKNLPDLIHTNVVGKGEMKEWVDKKSGKTKRQAKWYFDALSKAKTPEERRTLRSKTFDGIANAMAEQYSQAILKDYDSIESILSYRLNLKYN
jgi:hypothetical protein|tara:strand:+ start:374 stop:1090 length:717 start_codon:yes stop_codon:yes gene_type:complete